MTNLVLASCPKESEAIITLIIVVVCCNFQILLFPSVLNHLYL